MTDHALSPEQQLSNLQARLHQLEQSLARARRRRRVAAATVLGGGIVTWAAAAFSAPSSPLDCTRDDFYCFSANTPAVASHVNSNFETLRRRIDTVSTSLATTQTALTAAEARYVPLAGGTMTGALTMTGARAILGGNSAGNIHIDASSAGSDGRTYVNWYGGKGIVLGNGSGGAIATLDSATSTTTINGRRVPSEIVKKSCTSSGTCTATCPTGTVIKLAFGFHGLAPNGTSGDWTCGGAYQWLGGCSDQTSCTVNAGCGSSGVWLECW